MINRNKSFTGLKLRSISIIIILIILMLNVLGCSKAQQAAKVEGPDDIHTTPNAKKPILEIEESINNGKEYINNEIKLEQLKKGLLDEYQTASPSLWGERIPGVITQIETQDKVIALTFDGCTNKERGFDAELMDFLIEENIPATLFVSGEWIDANLEVIKALAKNPLFDIENHGLTHRPLSVNGKSVYGILGTRGVDEVIDEILLNDIRIEELTGRKTRYFRSGTAYYDDVSIQIAGELGKKVIGYNLLGDAGATFSEEQVYIEALKARAGSIALYHMNHPDMYTAEGLRRAIPELRTRGYSFVKLSDYDQWLK